MSMAQKGYTLSVKTRNVFAMLTETKTFNRNIIEVIKSLGCKVEIKKVDL
jgi:hypothetical protein